LDLEELILHYYLKVFSIIIFSFIILFLIYFFYVLNKKIVLSKNYFTINKGEKLEIFVKKNITNYSSLDIQILNIYYLSKKIILNKFIHYGDFYIENQISSTELLEVISNPSNVITKVTIIEGWSKNDLKSELTKIFKNAYEIPYEDIIADTYYIDKNMSFKLFHQNLISIKNRYLKKFKDNIIYKSYTDEDIFIIGSLIEKEGLNKEDKKNISSVILNRLNNKMKLQIDATVLYALTDGQYNLKRKLLFKDLKIKHSFNTYVNKGLPPKPISYVGRNTIDIIFQNHETDFLFYFFNNSLNKHIFSNNYQEHKNKLNEYRNQK